MKAFLVYPRSTFELGNSIFKEGQEYRAMLDIDRKEVIVYGEPMTYQYFENNFSFYKDKVIKDLEKAGIVVNGKMCTKTHFLKTADFRLYEGRKVRKYIVYIFVPGTEKNIYGIYVTGTTKAQAVFESYEYLKGFVEGSIPDYEAFDKNFIPNIQHTRWGIQPQYRDLNP